MHLTNFLKAQRGRLGGVKAHLLGALLVMGLNGCKSGGESVYNLTPTSPDAKVTLTSPAFTQGQPIPKQYSCDGSEASPPLQWSDPPPGTKSLALIHDDPDVKGMVWVHWVLYNLPPTTRSLPENLPKGADGPDGSKHGKNSWENPGYGGLCPPAGTTHRYFFKLYALDTTLDLASGATADQLRAKMHNHVLAHAELMGTYSK